MQISLEKREFALNDVHKFNIIVEFELGLLLKDCQQTLNR